MPMIDMKFTKSEKKDEAKEAMVGPRMSNAFQPAGITSLVATSKSFTIPGNRDLRWLSAVTSGGVAAPGLFVTPGLGQ